MVHNPELSSDFPQRGAEAEPEAGSGMALLGCPAAAWCARGARPELPQALRPHCPAGAPQVSTVPLYPPPCPSAPGWKERGRW